MPIKYVIKNVFEKKWRAILIILVIMSAVALFFTSNGIINAIMNIYDEQILAEYGNADFVVQATENSGLLNIHELDTSDINGKVKYYAGSMYLEGKLELAEDDVGGAIIGVNYKDLAAVNPVKVIDGSIDYHGNEILIDKKTADKYNIELNQIIKSSINGREVNLEVIGIVANSGFSSDTEHITVFMDISTLSDLKIYNGRVSAIYVKCGNERKSNFQILDTLKLIYSKANIINTSSDSFRSSIIGVRIGFQMLFIVTSIVSIYILYITMRILTVERMNVLATYKSLGASRKWIIEAQMRESIVLGGIGGILGLGTGIILLKIVVYAMVSEDMFQFYEYHLSISDVITVFVAAFIITFLGSVFPIIDSSRISLIQLITGLKMKERKGGKARYILGFFLLITGIVIPFFYIREISLALNIVSLIIIIFSVVMLVPAYTKVIRCILGKVSGLISNTTFFALRNVSNNYHLISNITLIALSTSIIIMISNSGSGMINSMSYAYTDSCKYDLQLVVEQLDAGFIERLDRIAEISDYYIADIISNVPVINYHGSIAQIEGVDFPSINQYRKYNLNDKYDIKSWGSDWIILSNALKQQFNVEIGDELILKINSNEYIFTVNGFMDTLINSGDYGLVDSKKLLECRGGDNNKNVRIYINSKTKNLELLKSVLLQNFQDYNVKVKSMEDLYKDIKSQSSSLLIGINCFTFIVMVIICIGMIGNQLLSSIYRRREFALLQVLGMSEKQKKRVARKEGVICVLLGIIIGTIYGCILLFVVGKILYAAYQPITIIPNPTRTLGTVIIIGILYIIMSCLIKTDNKRIRIKDCLSYE